MAYAALVSLSQILEQQVTDVDQQQVISDVREKCWFLQSFMEDYYVYNNGAKVDPLEERIREAAYQAENIIERHFLNRVRSERSLPFKYGQMQILEKRYGRDLKRLNENFHSIMEDAKKIKSDYHVGTPIQRYSLAVGSSRQETVSRGSTIVMGLDNDLLEMKARLCGESPKLQIISVVGMGGIGKTTLAKTIFDDSLVAQHFYTRAWTTLSQEYCMRDILLGLLNSLRALTNDLSKKSDEILAEHVYKSLKGRRYLIVMDDMWSTKAWDEIRRVVPDDNIGSRVIITSRLSEVALYADSSSPLHHIQLLNVDQSWSLLQQKVSTRKPCPPELQEIGKMIAKKCGGLPLAVVLVAGLLSEVDATLNHWGKFAGNVSSTLETHDDHLFKILSLSYNNLPHHLRACFLYFGIFPEDSAIPIKELTMLWTAEAFLKPISSKRSEEVAEEYVLDLVKRSLISITTKSSTGKFRFCHIHDLVRDFCIRKAHDENFLRVIEKCSTLQDRRRLHNSTIVTRGSFVRSHLFSNYDNQQHLTSLALSSKLLRVLNGPNVSLTCIPAAITELVHLRYLAFCHDHSVHFVVPARIIKLRNLQTLIIGPSGVSKVFISLVSTVLPFKHFDQSYFTDEPKIHLPPEIRKMQSLRHLILNSCCFLPLTFSKDRDGKSYVLKNLHTLSVVANFSFTEESVEMIRYVKKMGVIYHVADGVNPVMKWSKYHLNNLIHLRQLESLKLMCSVFPTSIPWLQSTFTKNFALPPNLKKLTLSCCGLRWRNLNIIGQSPNLEVLKLRLATFDNKEWKLTEGEFLKLRFLLMDTVDVESWQVEHEHFPSLERLMIRNCWNLKEIPCEIGDIPTLRFIEVVSGTKSARDSAIRIQEEQRDYGNDSLQVHVHNQ